MFNPEKSGFNNPKFKAPENESNPPDFLDLNKNNQITQHLQEYLGLKEADVEKIKILKAKDLTKNYQSQLNAFCDERLGNVTIAVIPDDLWAKGKHPSETNASNQLILIKESYFETQDNSDEIAWLSHELAHCQNFLDSESSEQYESNMQKPAFDDITQQYVIISRTELQNELNQIKNQAGDAQDAEDIKKFLEMTDEDTIKIPVYYPNNPVEHFAFTKQFQFLKKQGKSKEDILAMIREQYDEKDLPFFNRLLSDIYEK